MATRFAGDFFGVSLVEPQRESSQLLDYYPELRRLAKKGSSTSSDGEGGARLYGGAVAVPAFAGFKTFEKTGTQEQKAAPLFYGFKTFSQPDSK